MAYLSENSIKISTIEPLCDGEIDLRFENTGPVKNIYYAYLGNLEAAKALSGNHIPLYQDALISLNLSVECFFKYVYFLLLEKFDAHTPTKKGRHPLGPIEYDGGFLYYHQAYKSKDIKYLSVTQFGHEVMELWTLLDRFTDARENKIFQNFKNHIPTQRDWVEARYQRRNHLQVQEEFIDYLSDFEQILSTVFSRLK